MSFSLTRWRRTAPRTSSWAASVLSLILAGFVLTGCPAGAELDDADLIFSSLPQDYAEGEACDGTRVFVQSCGFSSGCHQSREDGSPPDGGVDLLAPDVAARLVGVPPTYPGHPECAGLPALLIDPDDVEESYLWKKVNDTHGECGDGMPTPYFGANKLSQPDLDCLRSWMGGVVAQAAAGDPEPQ